MDRETFFAAVRVDMFYGSLHQEQVDGVNCILDNWELVRDRCGKHQLAYVFATGYRETAFTMQPISERGNAAYFKRRYDIQGEDPPLARRLGNLQPGDGVKFRGRGYPQTTGRANYLKLTKLVNQRRVGLPPIDFVANPDDLLKMEFAGIALFEAMIEGIYTGKCLDDYIDETSDTSDFVQARRIINGLDRATLFAMDAVKALAALTKAGA